MRHTITIPASHHRAALAHWSMFAVDVGRDILYRAADDDVARFSKFPDSLVDMSARGVVEIIVDDGASRG